ncbi:hydantoinase B/oxoprolinase family protein [Celeribacter halophilus]|jgi:N-methylhydantoinase B|uniref:hydantoinase B/oxoprolinase family protein n=1 Tax=Celeribacter halophilus TaxID=576117 RepID=UPI003A9368F8
MKDLLTYTGLSDKGIQAPPLPEDRMTEFKTSLDPITFEVLRNAFVNIVDQMAEQLLRTCYSFVIYCRDFSSGLCDPEGNLVMQGTGDIAAHVGTLHYTCKAIIEEFGDDIHPGDVFIINDPFRGGSHFNDTRIVRPMFYKGQLIGYSQANGHWADVGGAAPGSFNITALDHMGEGLRITPVRVWSKGVWLEDVANLLAANTRNPGDVIGDMQAQAEATAVSEREIVRLCEKYGVDTIKTAFAEVQDYVEVMMRSRLEELPDGTWYAEDYIDQDPKLDEGMIPVKIKLTIDGNHAHYDLSGSHPQISTFLNSGYGGSFAGVVAGTKYQFPDLPLNSGLYRAVTVNVGEPGTVVNAEWPSPTAGFCSGPFEKLMNSVFGIWADILPERTMGCAFNLEYLLVGGRDTRLEDKPYFMWYDWMAGGWGGRNGRDGFNATAPVFGAQYGIQPLEGQERLAPVLTECHDFVQDSAGPGESRGGLGAEKGGSVFEGERIVMSYCCDRERSVTWGMWGGLPSIPHGVWLNKGTEKERYLGSIFSNLPLEVNDVFTRPSAGGGGVGDPLLRDPQLVCEDVADEYVSVERAKVDYGVVIKVIDRDLAQYEVDFEATKNERAHIANARFGWLEVDPETVAQRYRDGEIKDMDCIRQFGVILDWGDGTLLKQTTEQFREMLQRRAVPYWGKTLAVLTEEAQQRHKAA